MLECSICKQEFENKDLRPYGKDGTNVCFNCGMKDIKTTTEQFYKYLEVSYNEEILNEVCDIMKERLSNEQN